MGAVGNKKKIDWEFAKNVDALIFQKKSSAKCTLRSSA
jgi:hypothetical protein